MAELSAIKNEYFTEDGNVDVNELKEKLENQYYLSHVVERIGFLLRYYSNALTEDQYKEVQGVIKEVTQKLIIESKSEGSSLFHLLQFLKEFQSFLEEDLEINLDLSNFGSKQLINFNPSLMAFRNYHRNPNSQDIYSYFSKDLWLRVFKILKSVETQDVLDGNEPSKLLE